MGLIEAIRRRKEIVAICALLVPGVVLVVSLTEDPRYEATATVRVDPGNGEELSPADVIGFADADEVALNTGEELGGASEDLVDDRVTVAEGAAANTYEVTASSDTPRRRRRSRTSSSSTPMSSGTGSRGRRPSSRRRTCRRTRSPRGPFATP
jgi:Chain length determinant protein